MTVKEIRKEKNPVYYCKRLRLLKYLLDNGFVWREKIPDPMSDTPNYSIWIFDRTPELTAALDEYFAEMGIKKEKLEKGEELDWFCTQ